MMSNREQAIENALKYYNDGILSCLATEQDAKRNNNDDLYKCAKVRRVVYQEYRKAIKYMRTSGCDKKEAWAMYGISLES
jgi:predicted site-specific integrase-resolvase